MTKKKFLDLKQKEHYGNSCWNINDHIKENSNILKILAW